MTGARACDELRSIITCQIMCRHPVVSVCFRIVDSTLDSLRPGMRVYVICTVLKNDWFRLYPAVVGTEMKIEQFAAHDMLQLALG